MKNTYKISIKSGKGYKAQTFTFDERGSFEKTKVHLRLAPLVATLGDVPDELFFDHPIFQGDNLRTILGLALVEDVSAIDLDDLSTEDSIVVMGVAMRYLKDASAKILASEGWKDVKELSDQTKKNLRRAKAS